VSTIYSFEDLSNLKTLVSEKPVDLKKIGVWLHNNIVKKENHDSPVKPSPSELNVRRFCICFSTFRAREIPFELWSDLCEEGIELLKKTTRRSFNSIY